MLMLRQSVVLLAMGASLLGGADPPPQPGGGDGFGSTRCSNVPSPACDVYAGTPGVVPVGPTPRTRGDPVPRRAPAWDTVPAPDVTCSYVRSDFQPPPGGVVTAAWRRPLAPAVATPAVLGMPVAQPPPTPGAGEGAWYVWRCSGNGARDAVFRPPVWIPNGAAAAAGPSAADLAEMARRQLRPGAPVIAASPVGEQLVNLPTWLWLDGGWAPAAATAAVPGVSVTARARPTSVIWRMGDGTQVVCAGPGTPFPAGADPASASPACGHVYRRSSADQPGQAFTVTATVVWTVTWAGAGQAGVFPNLQTTAAAAFRVAESQAVNGSR